MNIRKQMEQIYRDVPLEDIPWKQSQPPRLLVEAARSGKIKPRRAVDLGCGAGNYAVWLAEQGFDVTGIDISRRALRYARNLAHSRGVSCRFVAADLLGDLKKFHGSFDLADIKRRPSEDEPAARVRERKNAGAGFVTARSGQEISSIAIWTGQGRQRKERKVNLTTPQGIFLYHFPFPDGEPLTIRQIMQKAGLEDDLASEILDLVELLLEYDVIETIE